jgi:uncharacterized delta-60 repeat protein
LLLVAAAVAVTAVFGAQPGAVDTTFQPGGGNNAGLDADVFAIAVQPDNKLVIGGAFTKVGRTSRNRVARLNQDGSLDTSFDPGSGTDHTIESLTLVPGGKMVVVGRFLFVNGLTQAYIARLNPNGTFDTTFRPVANDLIVTVVAQPDGKVLVGGGFTAINDVPRPYLARLDLNGAVDLSFDPNVGPNGPVHTMAVMSDGRVLIGGQFGSVQGAARGGVARLQPNGALDATFDPGLGANQVVTATALLPDHRVYIGGQFTNVAGATRHYVARLQANGTLDSAFVPHIDLVWGGVLATQTAAGGGVYVGGEFYVVDGVSRVGIARLQTGGALDLTFDPGTGVANRDSLSPLVRAVTIQPDGKVLIGGRFTSVNGINLNYIARLVGDPPGPPVFTSVERLAADRLRLTVSAPANAVCVLEQTPDWKAWTPIQTNVALGGTCIFEDASLTQQPRRFYRVYR